MFAGPPTASLAQCEAVTARYRSYHAISVQHADKTVAAPVRARVDSLVRAQIYFPANQHRHASGAQVMQASRIESVVGDLPLPVALVDIMAPFPGHEIALYATFAARYPQPMGLSSTSSPAATWFPWSRLSLVQSFSTIAA